MDFLQVSGNRIISATTGREIRLRGFSFAGWLNFENFIMGAPGHESGLRRTAAKVLGPEKAQVLFDSFLNHFITEDDFAFMESLGCNLVRIPFNYRHFESDDEPFAYLDEGFRRLDQAIAWASAHGVYLVLDLHAAQGCQNRGFFCDNNTGISFLWEQKMYRDRAVALWRELARRYRAEPAIAGYDLLNEPIPPDMSLVNDFYRQAAAAIRETGDLHMLFLEGDDYSTRFEEMDPPFDANLVYSTHYYSCAGMDIMEYPAPDSQGLYYDREQIRQEYLERRIFMRRYNVPNWFGETSVTFPPGVTEESRLRFLRDILSIAEEEGDSWTFGIYKDIGKTGVVYAKPDSPWMKTVAPVLNAIAELGCNPFANPGEARRIDKLCGGLADYVQSVLPGDGDGLHDAVRFDLCENVMPRFLQISFARLFADKSEQEIDQIMDSFSLRNCARREGWMNVVKQVTGKDQPE